MKVLIGCEYSASVRDTFREMGHDAWSVDFAPTEGDPTYHIEDDLLEVVKWREWDMLIAFPPCTHLSLAGAHLWKEKQSDGRLFEAASFVMKLWASDVPRVCIENPKGWLNSNWQKPQQIIQPYMFGDPWRKATCLWLRGLQPLRPTNRVEPIGSWVKSGNPDPEESARIRSLGGHQRNARERARTFPGVARAMAEQWGVLNVAVRGPRPEWIRENRKESNGTT